MEKKTKILVADRNGNVRGLLRRELESEGHLVALAANGAELMIMLDRDVSFDLLVIDPDLPLGGRKTILERVKERNSRIPIIVHSDQECDAKYMELGLADGFIEKGGDLDLLKETVAHIIEDGEKRIEDKNRKILAFGTGDIPDWRRQNERSSKGFE